jgi:hypothetical protein
MPATYEPIATTTLGSAASSITFSTIPATYTDLRLVLKATSTGNCDVLMRFNSDSSSNYSLTILSGNGTTASSYRDSNQTSMNFEYASTALSTTPTLYQSDIFSYAGSTYKTTLFRESGDLNGSGNLQNTVFLWRSTSAITTINLLTSANNFATGTTATLYGIKAA